MEDPIPPSLPTKKSAAGEAVAGAIIFGLPFTLFLYMMFHSMRPFAGEPHFGAQYTITLIVLLPLIQGFLYRYIVRCDPPGIGTHFLACMVILLLDFSLAALALGEGVICLLLAAPLYIALIFLGIGLGALCSSMSRKHLSVSLLPLLIAGAALDAGPPPLTASVISDSVTIDAPPSAVWQYIVQYPVNTTPPEYWLWRIGLPEPIQSIASAAKVGAARQCIFTNHVAFTEEITELVPNKVMTFKVTKQPDDPEILGHMIFDKGQLYLEPNPDGTTTVIATSWYRLRVRPAVYFNWWATDIVRNVHFRVLNHIKNLAETPT